jgi:hypothetical protein
MAINFQKPAITDAYNTEFVPNIVNNMIGLARWLDSAQETISGSIPSYAKRMNRSSGLIEEYNGSAWLEFSTGYAKKSGGNTFAGTQAFTGTVSIQAGLDFNGGEFSFAGNGTPDVDAVRVFGSSKSLYLQMGGGGQTVFRNKSATTLGVITNNGNFSWGFTSDQGFLLSVNGQQWVKGLTLSSGQSELHRLQNDNAYLSFFNTAGNTRSGYIQFNVGSSFLFMTDGAVPLQFGTNGNGRMFIDPDGTVRPAINNTYALGTSSARWVNMFGLNADFTGSVYGGSTAAEAFVVRHDNGYISLKNGALSARAGYLQGNAGSNVALVSETPDLVLAANTTISFRAAGVGGGSVLSLTASRATFNVGTLTTSVAVAYSAVPAIDATRGNYFEIGTLTGNVTGLAISSPAAGQALRIRFLSDATARTVALSNLGAANAPLIAGSYLAGANKVNYLDVMYNVAAARFEGVWTNL